MKIKEVESVVINPTICVDLKILRVLRCEHVAYCCVPNIVLWPYH